MKWIISILLIGWLGLSASATNKCETRQSPSPLPSGDYDFIIVGGGTAGAIVAARLSAKYDVLLVESGYRLYDDPVLSAKMFSTLMTGADLSKVIDGVNPIIKKIGSFRAKDKSILDSDGKVVGDMDTGIPGFMPHLQDTPFLALYLSMTEATHHYPTVPLIYSQKRELVYPRGNMLGGSSAANTMVYFRGSVHDFNQWEGDFGLKGWNYNDVLPYFKKFENNQDVSDSKVHGHSGPINITVVKKHLPAPAAEAWSQTARDMGYSDIDDSSNPETTYGVSHSWQQFVGADGKRSDSSAYIRILDGQGKVCWNKARSECAAGQTLHIWTKTYSTKVLFEGTRAYGIEYTQDEKSSDRTEAPGKKEATDEAVKHHTPFNKWDRLEVQKKMLKQGAPVAKELAFDWDKTNEQYIPESVRSFTPKKVTAKYEVILSAGCVGSAQLLMLSGIGPADHLKERGIPVVADLPVGQRLQDHQEVVQMWKFPKEYDPGFDFLSETVKGFPTLRAHLRGERSFFSSNGIPAGLEGSSAGPKGTIPKWHLHHITMGAFEQFDYNIASYPETVQMPYRLPRSLMELYAWKGLHLHVHNCELSQNHAYGRLELRNKDPFQPPFLDPRYGSSDEDNAELVDCLLTVREIMAKTDPKFAGEELEPSKSAKTKEQLTQFVRNAVWGHHISGSAPMGNCTTPFAVADGDARVYGVDGLRVVDISLFPTIPHGNPAAVVMMIGEKIADSILQAHSTVKSSSGSANTHDEL